MKIRIEKPSAYEGTWYNTRIGEVFTVHHATIYPGGKVSFEVAIPYAGYSSAFAGPVDGENVTIIDADGFPLFQVAELHALRNRIEALEADYDRRQGDGR